MTDLYHWYHVYADGDWKPMVDEHAFALQRYGLYENLTEMFVGFVGSKANISEAKEYLVNKGLEFTVCAEKRKGWEQVTQDQIWEFSLTHDGLCLYAHTKGSANPSPVTDGWRRYMTWYNVCDWVTPRQHLLNGKRAAGCYWVDVRNRGVEFQAHPHPPYSVGYFAGTFWWTHLSELRAGDPPMTVSRFDAEHWIGKLKPTVYPHELALLGDPTRWVGDHTSKEVNWCSPDNTVSAVYLYTDTTTTKG